MIARLLYPSPCDTREIYSTVTVLVLVHHSLLFCTQAKKLRPIFSTLCICYNKEQQMDIKIIEYRLIHS